MVDVPVFSFGGEVVNRVGQPVAGAVVMAVAEQPADLPVWPLRCVTTDARGRFTMTALPAGPYSVTAARPRPDAPESCRPGSSPLYREDSTVQMRIEISGQRDAVRVAVRD
jgi:hypothetical protein